MKTSRRQILVAGAVGQAGLALGAQAQPIGPDAPGEALSAHQFGARGDGTADDHAALTSAIAAAVARKQPLVLPAGVYLHSRPLNLGFSGLRVQGLGSVTLRHTGRGSPCIVMDAGESGILYNHVLENVTIEGSGASGQDGVFVRNMPHGIRRNIRVRNVTGRAFHILGDVLSTWENCIVSPNEGAFQHLPARGFEIGGTPAVSGTTALVFINCIAECAREFGWYLDRCDASRWLGGTSEGLGRHGRPRHPAIGVFIGPNSTQNSFDGLFMEQNDGGDVVIEGHSNHFADCVIQTRSDTSPYEALRSIVVRAGARGNRFEGGSAYSALIERGALNTTVRHMEFGHKVDDLGTGTVIADCLQLHNSASRFPSRTFGNVEDYNPLALDWYEELEFEPSFKGSEVAGSLAYARRAGVGTRIGNMFFFSLELAVEAVSRAPGGQLSVVGLPFPASSKIGSAITISEASNVESGGGTLLGAHVDPGRQEVVFIVSGQGSRSTTLQAAAIRPGAVLRLSGQYRVAP